MKHKSRYSIGDVSRICNISKKALRYYDEINIIHSKRQDYNNYRFYTYDSLLAVPIIKYYKQMGFKLEEMRQFIEGNIANVYTKIKNSFSAKIEELETQQEAIRRQYVSVKDWYDLILEAEMVIDNGICEPSVKFVGKKEYVFQEQPFADDIKGAIINIDFTNHIERLDNGVTGPVVLHFPSLKLRTRHEAQHIRILQRTLLPCPKLMSTTFGGHMMATCYHTGPHETIGEAYAKLNRWANTHRYVLAQDSYERYVTDYWTTRNSAQFVTEILIKASRRETIQ
jgi:DNA-binding transcriptional MerR regulator